MLQFLPDDVVYLIMDYLNKKELDGFGLIAKYYHTLKENYLKTRQISFLKSPLIMFPNTKNSPISQLCMDVKNFTSYFQQGTDNAIKIAALYSLEFTYSGLIPILCNLPELQSLIKENPVTLVYCKLTTNDKKILRNWMEECIVEFTEFDSITEKEKIIIQNNILYFAYWIFDRLFLISDNALAFPVDRNYYQLYAVAALYTAFSTYIEFEGNTLFNDMVNICDGACTDEQLEKVLETIEALMNHTRSINQLLSKLTQQHYITATTPMAIIAQLCPENDSWLSEELFATLAECLKNYAKVFDLNLYPFEILVPAFLIKFCEHYSTENITKCNSSVTDFVKKNNISLEAIRECSITIAILFESSVLTLGFSQTEKKYSEGLIALIKDTDDMLITNVNKFAMTIALQDTFNKTKPEASI